MYQVILFDLDGTLTDSGEGIANSVDYALKRYGITETDRSKLFLFVGPPLTESFRKYYHFSEEDAKEAVNVYREYYIPKGIYENSVYEGIPKLLQRLKKEGKKIAVATSKPEELAKKVLDHFQITQYFDCISGATMDEKKVEKPEIIKTVLEELKIQDKSCCVMVGDRLHDIIGAKENGIDSIGVLYGFGSKEELESYGATYIVKTPEEIFEIAK